MATYTINVGGKEFDLDTEMSQDQLNSYLSTDEGQSYLQQQIAAVQAPAAPDPNATPVPDLAAAEEAAVRKYAEGLSGAEKFAIGAGKEVNDLVVGAKQLAQDIFGGNGGDTAEEVKSENRLFGILDEGVGAEDFGQLAGTIGTYLAGGTAGATIKGGAILGSIVEGMKASESDTATGRFQDRLLNSAIGGAGGAAGGYLGEKVGGALSAYLAGKMKPKLGESATQILSTTDDIFTKQGKIDAASGVSNRLGLSARIPILGGFAVRGAAEQLVKYQRASAAKATLLLRASNKATSAKEKELLAEQAQQLSDLGAGYLKKAEGIFNKLTPEAQRAVVYQSIEQTIDNVERQVVQTTAKSADEVGTKLVRQPKPEGVPKNAPATYAEQQVRGSKVSSSTSDVATKSTTEVGTSGKQYSLQDIMRESTTIMPDGRAGIDPGVFVKLTSFLDNEAVTGAWPQTVQRQIKALRTVMQTAGKKGKYMTTAQLRGILSNMAKIQNDDLLRTMAAPINASEKKIADGLLDYALSGAQLTGRSAMGAASGVVDQGREAMQ